MPQKISNFGNDISSSSITRPGKVLANALAAANRRRASLQLDLPSAAPVATPVRALKRGLKDGDDTSKPISNAPEKVTPDPKQIRVESTAGPSNPIPTPLAMDEPQPEILTSAGLCNLIWV